jgi:lipopolysaccharide export LptBFGC system permease protein LptF
MKTLDRYILRNFLTSALLCLVALMSVRIVADLSFNIDEFAKVEERQPGKTVVMILVQIATYYGFQSLAYFRELGGVIIVAAAAFSLWRMNHTNELTAVLASGVSLHRVLLPVVLCCVGLNLLVTLDSEVFIPLAKQHLVRSRDDPTGSEALQVRLVTDSQNSAWYSRRFVPSTGRLAMPLIILRDQQQGYAGCITGPTAHYGAEAGGWVLAPAPGQRHAEAARQARLQVPGWQQAATTAWIPTGRGPAQMIEQARAQPRNRAVNWREARAIRAPQIEDPAVGLTITGGRLRLRAEGEQIVGTVLEQPRFLYRRPDGSLLATFLAADAYYYYDPPQTGWVLREGKLVYHSDLTPADLALRQSSNWLAYMSTGELNRLLRLEQVPDLAGAMLVRHCRFADFFNNLIMLLVAVPFILSRERNIKASAGLTVLMVGVVYVVVYFARYVGLAPVIAAWLPVLLFGPLATFMLDAVKT